MGDFLAWTTCAFTKRKGNTMLAVMALTETGPVRPSEPIPNTDTLR